MARLRKSGEIAAKTGEYEERGPRGGKLADDKTVTIDDRTDRLPSTQRVGGPMFEQGRQRNGGGYRKYSSIPRGLCLD